MSDLGQSIGSEDAHEDAQAEIDEAKADDERVQKSEDVDDRYNKGLQTVSGDNLESRQSLRCLSVKHLLGQTGRREDALIGHPPIGVDHPRQAVLESLPCRLRLARALMVDPRKTVRV